MPVATFKELVEERLGVAPDNQRLICCGKPLIDDTILRDSAIRNGSTVFLVLRLPGGSNLKNGYKQHFDKMRTFPAGAPKHTDSCPICYDEDMPALKMPCKHAICPGCLMNRAWTEISSNGKSIVNCPFCETEWPPQIIWRYGNATTHEMDLLEEGMSLNYLHKSPDISDCPGCNNYFERKDKTSNRINCMICKKMGKPDSYCFHCFKPWKNGQSTNDCGNPGCNSAALLDLLCKAPKVTPKYLQNVTVPSRRACPACGIIIELKEGCKHMECTECRTKFCFVCLQKAQGGSWECGRHNTPCVVAPVQDRIPRRSVH